MQIITVSKTNLNSNFNTSNFPSDWDCIVSAYNQVEEGGVMVIEEGQYNVDNSQRLVPRSNTTIQGIGPGKVFINGFRESDWLVLNPSVNASEVLNNFKISNLNFDLCNGSNASVIQLRDANNCTVENCHFKNGSQGSWFVVFGSEVSSETDYLGNNNLISNCKFENHCGSLEMLLIFNQKYFKAKNLTFKNKLNGPTLGMWQKTYNTVLEDIEIIDCSSQDTFYYSITCDQTKIIRPRFINSGGITGANVSDNGMFGSNVCQGLEVIEGIFEGGINSKDSKAIQIGGTVDARIIKPTISGYATAIVLSKGNGEECGISSNVEIIEPIISNINPTNDFHRIHNAFGFYDGVSDVTIKGGRIELLTNCPNPISFNSNNSVYKQIRIKNLKFDSNFKHELTVINNDCEVIDLITSV